MSEPKIDLKNPLLAAVLAYLIPGAGHFYQRRFFKAAVYSVCILGTFLYGMHLGEWKVVYARETPGLWYCQYLVGLPTLPAVVQARRYDATGPIRQGTISEPLTSGFLGRIEQRNIDGTDTPEQISGTLSLQPNRDLGGASMEGEFQGSNAAGEPVRLTLGNSIEIEKKIFAHSRRGLRCDIVEVRNGQPVSTGKVVSGTVARPLWNWFEVPLAKEDQKRLQGKLGKFYELAEIFTWIAGLLNILAIWDAMEGPAYGYGDRRASEPDPEPADDSSNEPDPPAGK